MRPQNALVPPASPGHRLANRRRLERTILAAAGVLFFCSVGAGPGERAARFAQAAFAAYRTYAGDYVEPVEATTTDPKVLDRWLKPQLAGPITVPALSKTGFALVGGRVTPGAQRPAAFVLYQNAAGERLGLAIEPGESASARRLIATAGETTAISFAARGPATLTLVGRIGISRLSELARLADAEQSPP